MKFGVCTSASNAAAVAAAGFDFLEENIQTVFQGQLPDERFGGSEPLTSAKLPVLAGNCMVPGSLKITGPDVHLDELRAYMDRALARAAATKLRTFVFGSGGARQVPEGWPRDKAKEQILEFCRMFAPMAAARKVTIVMEPLRTAECNIVNSVPEAMEYVLAVDHPAFRCLVDSYHFWEENDSLEELRKHASAIRHVHVADKGTRVAPGESGQSDYRPLFSVLKAARYKGLVSVEARGLDDIAGIGPRVVTFLRKQWAEA